MRILRARLGRVDGFDQDEGTDEGNERTVVSGCLFTAQGNALEAFDFAHRLLDARASPVEQFGEETGFIFCSRSVGNGGAYATLARSVAVGFGVVSFIGERGARRDVRTDVEQSLELRAVAGLPAGQEERDRQAVEIGLEMDFR